jgi:lipopolysaccharide transport system ATP-binding protein
MSDIAIHVESLSKKYLVGHQSRQRDRYATLRDALGREARNLARKTGDMLRGRPIVQGDEVREFWALRDVDFEIKKGDVVGVVGRNGAGKSTLLKVLSRVTEPSAGRVRLTGRIASLLEVGTGFHPELSGRENIFLNAAILGMSRKEVRRKFDEIVAFAEVENFLDTPVKRYSSGMYVRLAFAVAAHLEPEILAVDEVLAVGDAAFQKKCLGKIDEVARSGRTVLFVSHNMNAVEHLCQRVLWFQSGKLAGSFDDVRLGVAAYLQDGVGLSAESSWEADADAGSTVYGNEYFLPLKLNIRSLATESAADRAFSNANAIVISIEGKVERADPAMNIGVAVYDETDELLFWTFTTDQPEQAWPIMGVGAVKLTTTIPPRLLNEGGYRIELLASLHFRAWILEPRTNVPFIRFSIRGGLSDSPYWQTKRPGLLAPMLAWNLV